MIPYLPLGTHSYMLSNKGANKLVNNKLLDKVKYHIDLYLSLYIFDKNMRVFAVTPPLITQDTKSVSDNQSDIHHLVIKTIGDINLTEQIPISTGLNTVELFLRPVGVPITVSSGLVFFLALFINAIPNPTLRYSLLVVLIVYELLELLYTPYNKTKLKTISLELLVIFLVTLLFAYSRK